MEEKQLKLVDEIIQKLQTVIDPELYVDIVNLGLICGIDLNDNNDCTVTMTLTVMGCPLSGVLDNAIKEAVLSIPEIKSCENDTKNNDGLILNIAINYGGRQELVHAFRKIASDVKAGILNPSEIDEENIKDALYASDADDVDLLIRTGGEQRISNFLLWQISYSELYFTSVLWPDFDERELENAIKWFVNRNRRFGGLMVNK